jgi:hypothetical protein
MRSMMRKGQRQATSGIETKPGEETGEETVRRRLAGVRIQVWLSESQSAFCRSHVFGVGQMMLDPVLSLAHSMYAAKGAYALLLGSGVSKAADIPTGWDIVVDLCGQYAAMMTEEHGGDPVAWYERTTGRGADYSDILQGLAPSADDRQKLLHRYFEPGPDSQPGEKVPTTAHRAIADLVRRGAIRVIITTNFDRLLELAMKDAGVTPIVISNADAAEGALPLVHQHACVIKLHGDYQDPRIKNSSAELAAYDPRLSKLLDQVLDEFGLVICGWSGQWDEALRKGFQRCKNRRFSTFWATRGKLAKEAEDLLHLRAGVPVPITDADEFFTKVHDAYIALEDLNAPHPLSAAVAAATAKRYLASPEHRIRLAELIEREADLSLGRVNALLSRLSKLPSGEEFTKLALGIWPALSVFNAAASVVSRWGDRDAMKLVATAVGRLASDIPLTSMMSADVSLGMRVLPGAIAFYIAGISAAAAENWPALAILFNNTMLRSHNYPSGLPFITHSRWYEVNGQCEELINRRTPLALQAWAVPHLRIELRSALPDDRQFDDAIDSFESFLGLAYFGRNNSIPLEKPGRPSRRPGLFLRRGKYGAEFPPRLVLEGAFDAVEYLADQKAIGVTRSQAKELCDAFIGVAHKDAESSF